MFYFTVLCNLKKLILILFGQLCTYWTEESKAIFPPLYFPPATAFTLLRKRPSTSNSSLCAVQSMRRAGQASAGSADFFLRVELNLSSNVHMWMKHR